MNERIKELVKQATLATYYNAVTGVTRETFDKEKFAELIVKECIDIANDTRYDGKIVANRIKFVFGVEE